MIISKITGGLGNQLFQYSIGRHLSIINNTDLKIDIDNYEGNIPDPMLGIRICGLKNFNIKADIATKKDLDIISEINKKNNSNSLTVKIIRKFSPYYKTYYIFESKILKFQPQILKIRSSHLHLKGCWAAEKYFSAIENTIRKDLTFKNEPDKINKAMIDDIKDSNSVCIHVRHGDNANGKAPKHGMLSLKYYDKAIKQLLNYVKNPVFYIFSDDPEWTRNNLKINYPTTYVSHNDDKNNHEDIRLMTYCKHHIIGNSTFSWWGAWLGKKKDQKVFAPRYFFIDMKKGDLYPKDWIIINE